MKHVNYIIAVILAIFWVNEYFKDFENYSTHFLLIGAFSLILINIIHYDESKCNKKNINHKKQLP